MLKRTPKCLEMSHRQLLRACNPPRHGRERLYTRSCHQSATGISTLWAAASLFGQVCRDRDLALTRHHHLTLLYSKQSFALLKHDNFTRSNDGDHRRQRLYSDGARSISTAQRDLQYNQVVDGDGEESVTQSVRNPVDSSVAIELKKLLQLRVPGQETLAWQLYTHISDLSVISDLHVLQAELLEYMIQDQDPATSSHAPLIFDQLPLAKRTASSYRALIRYHIGKRTVGPAIQLLEEAMARKDLDKLQIGIEFVLGRTIFEEQWDLSLRVFSALLRSTHAIDVMHISLQKMCGQRWEEIWTEVKQLPELMDNLTSFLNYVREYKRELTSTSAQTEALHAFADAFVPQVMDFVLEAYGNDRAYLKKWFLAFFAELDTLRLPPAACYEHALKSMLKLALPRRFSHRQPPWRALYENYRIHYLKRPSDFSRPPSRPLLAGMINFYSKQDALKEVEETVQHFCEFYPNTNLNANVLKSLIYTFARYGEKGKVFEYFEQLEKHHNEQVDLNVLSGILYCYARRADVVAAENMFNKIRNEYEMKPDIVCWNTLLLAYARADDLDGSLECFNRCMDAGVAPTENTFGPLLYFCAARGDVEAFETLFARAEQVGIPLNSSVRAKSGYVQVFLNAGDPEGAEAIAQGMLASWKAGALKGHPLTHTWNLLIQHYALNGNVTHSRYLYKQMLDNDIPLDSWTYGSLMRALIEAKQTNAAYKILRETMPANDVQVHALHFAIVMTGFLREGQSDRAIHAHERMKTRLVTHTESSREASMKTLGTVRLEKLKKRKARSLKYRLKEVEEALQEMLVAGTGREEAHPIPRHTRQLDPGTYGIVPQAYYGLMISLYSSRGALEIAKKLSKRVIPSPSRADTLSNSITLAVAMMETHLKAKEYDKVAEFWKTAHATGTEIVKTFRQASEPATTTGNSSSVDLIDSDVRNRFEMSYISNNRRHILVRATRLYMRSLLTQPGFEAISKAQKVIYDLLAQGFAIDTFVWNEFIGQLAERKRILDAFALCEIYLMPRFPGWRVLHPGYIRHDPKGQQLMDIRLTDAGARTVVMPRYKMLVILAKAYGEVVRDERNGIGYDPERSAWIREILEETGPMTIRAIQSMPVTYDRLQTEYFKEV